jgi:hypothetical protein
MARADRQVLPEYVQQFAIAARPVQKGGVRSACVGTKATTADVPDSTKLRQSP